MNHGSVRCLFLLGSSQSLWLLSARVLDRRFPSFPKVPRQEGSPIKQNASELNLSALSESKISYIRFQT